MHLTVAPPLGALKRALQTPTRQGRGGTHALRVSINHFYKKVLKKTPKIAVLGINPHNYSCLLYTSPSPRDVEESRMPSSA